MPARRRFREPYTGPTATELARKDRAKTEKREALKRAREERREIEEREAAKLRARTRRAAIQFLTDSYPSCKGCATKYDCAGFIGDVFRPTFCVLCGHERDTHTLMRDYNDETLTDEMLEDFQETIKFHLKRTEGGGS